MDHQKPVRAGSKADLETAFTTGLPLSAETEPHLGGALRQTLDHPGSLVRARLVYEMGQAYGLSDGRQLHRPCRARAMHKRD